MFETSDRLGESRERLGENLDRAGVQLASAGVCAHPAGALNDSYRRTQNKARTLWESTAPILEFLFQHQIQPEFTARISWRPGTAVIWDNRSSQHCAINDYDGHRREMWRITLDGDAPR